MWKEAAGGELSRKLIKMHLEHEFMTTEIDSQEVFCACVCIMCSVADIYEATRFYKQYAWLDASLIDINYK